MKKIRSILSVLSIVGIILLFASCSQEELGTPFYAGQEVSISAALSSGNNNGGPKRISGKDNVDRIDLTWDEGDKILVTVGDKSSEFILSEGADSGNGTFTGTMPADGTTYQVSYPVNYDESVLTNQTYVENGFGNGLMKMSTKQNGTLDNGFVLSADNAVLGLQLTGSQTLGKIVLTNTATTKTYTLHCDGVVLTAEAILFYIVVPVKDWANGMRVEVYDNDGDIILMKEKAGEIMFSATDAMVMPTLQTRERGKRIGIFSVGEGKYVSFSQGNLQYVQSTDEWRFAREQYEYIGKGNITNGQLGQIIDMFGWSVDADPANKWGVTIAQEGFDGDFVDWGLNYIHGEAPGSWRTLSQDEWSYLLSCRQHATELWGVAQVAGVNGVIILPDRWSPTDDLPFVAGINENGYAAQQTLSVEQWQLMEELGAVFLPAAGGRNGASLAFSHIDSVGWYWLSTPTDPGKASCVRFECNLMVQRNGLRQAGLSVRLVHDTIVPEAVDLGLSVKWATFNVGATSPEDYGDYFAWGETEPKEIYSWATYKWGTSSNQTKYNTTDGKTILDLDDDAAYVNWGGNWRMPSKEEVDELTQQCNWIWTTHNNVNGYKVTGPNGNSIFLPAAGYKGAGPTYPAGEDGLYWTNTTEKQHYSYLIVLHDDAPPTQAGRQGTRCFGFTIRPVCEL